MSIPSSNFFVSKTFTSVEINPSVPYDFKVTAASHFRVSYITAAGVKTSLANVTDYVVSNVGNKNGGSINLIKTVAVGDKLVADLDNVPATQGTTFDYANLWQSNALEVAFDYVTNLFKRLLGVTTRCLQLPEEDQGDTVELPQKLSRRNTVVGFDDSGDMTTFDSASLSAGVGITGSRKQFSVATGTTVTMGEFTMVNTDTSVRLTLKASVGATGSIRVREYYITHKTGQATLIVSSIDNFKTGLTGAKDVTFSATPSATGVTISIVGTNLDAGSWTVDTNYTIETFVNLSDGNFVFA